MNTITRLRQLAILSDEAAEALHSGGVETLVLNTFLDAATPIWTAIQQDAAIANTPEAPASTAAPAAPDTSSAPQTPPESASAGTPEAKPSAIEPPVSIPASKIETLRPEPPQKPSGIPGW